MHLEARGGRQDLADSYSYYYYYIYNVISDYRILIPAGISAVLIQCHVLQCHILLVYTLS